jgi:UDP-N-acetylmuramate: L-alanyl-gamma-D-glutamyl-meso-diaminopimelate ligase
MELTPQIIYERNIDKQRIVITGSERSKLASMIIQILQTYQRKFDHYADGKVSSVQGGPLVIIESPASTGILGYRHHVGILTSNGKDELNQLTKFADATPKSGILFYPEMDNELKTIGGKERTDVLAIPYKMIPHELKDGKTILVSSTNEKFPTQITGSKNLLLLAAAKELLKKIGITSGQFYRAASNLS